MKTAWQARRAPWTWVRHYRYFVALAEALHFGRAAERLGISQPALSQQLRWIEQRVGAPLLARGGRRLALTEVGTVLLREAQDVLRRLQLAELATARASRDGGSIAIGYVASAALSGLLPRLIHRFRGIIPTCSSACARWRCRCSSPGWPTANST